MYKGYRLAVMSLFACMVSACTDTPDATIESAAVVTSEMYATFRVVSDGGSRAFVDAQITVQVPPSNRSDEDIFVILSPEEDRLLATTSGDISDQQLNGDDLFFELDALYEKYEPLKIAQPVDVLYDFIFLDQRIYTSQAWYFASLPISVERQFNVSLLRAEHSNAEGSTVLLPQPFIMSIDNTAVPISRENGDIRVQWSPREQDVTVEVAAKVSCPSGAFSSDVISLNSDIGEYTIEGGALAGDSLVGTCSTTVSLRKIRIGQLDAAFTGGIIVGIETRSAVLQTSD